MPLDSHEKPIFKEITTIEEAQKYIRDMVEVLREVRANCDAIIPGNNEMTVAMQTKAYDMYRIRYGQALGSLVTLMHCRKLNDVAYNKLREEIMQTAVPTVVGSVG